MKLSALPPVRRAVPLRRRNSGARSSMERFFGNRRITLYASGTAALAQAMANCAALSSATTPEVIIPAYGCPDLVSACVHASVYPRLVDIARCRWSYDHNALRASLSSNTAAIVAVNLLGLGDGSEALLPLCRERRVPLIQDSAQCFPREPTEWPGDYVVLSFGRGKPMNLLHGGALVAAPGDSGKVSVYPARYSGKHRLLASRAASIAFNVLTRPRFYRMISTLPGTRLGKVVYKPLRGASLLPERAWKQVGAAFELYRRTPSYRRDIWTSAIEEWLHLGILPLDSPGSPPPAEPLRLALLAPDRTARDLLVTSLNDAGLGASRLYGTDLTAIDAIPPIASRQGPFPNANELGARLFTLPTHSLVTLRTVESARAVVHAVVATGGYRTFGTRGVTN